MSGIDGGFAIDDLRARRRRRIRIALAAGAMGIALAVAGATAPAWLAFGPPVDSDEWQADVDRIEAELLPAVQELQVSHYLLHPGPSRLLEYRRGKYGDPAGEDVLRMDSEAGADFDRMTGAVERAGLPIERIFRVRDGVYFQLEDSSWQHNWAYVLLPDAASPPATTRPEEEWTHVRDGWWFHRAFDD